MFKVIFTQRISVRGVEPCETRQSIWLYEVGKKAALPFIPDAKMPFLDGECEITSKDVYWDIQEERFVVVCDGMLCDDEQDAKESLDYELSRGWTLIRKRESQ